MYINPLSLGYESISEIGIITELSNKEEVAESLRANPIVWTVPSALGKYDIYGVVKARNMDQLAETIRLVDTKPLVKSLDLLIFADLWDNPWHPENLAVDLSERRIPIVRNRKSVTKFAPVSLDETDKRIAKFLMKDSRMPFSDIAGKLGKSTNNVIHRYKRLREKNVLSLATISIDLVKLGYNAILDSYMKIDNRGNLPDVESQLLQLPNLLYCAKFIGGSYDLRAATVVADFQDVFRYREQISAIKSVERVEFYLHEFLGSWPVDPYGKSLLE